MSNVSVEEKKIEAFNRMESLGLFMDAWEFNETGEIRLFLQNADLFLCVKGKELEQIRAFELSYNALVFAVIRTFTSGGMMDSYLFVSDYPEEWADDRRLLLEGEATAYVYNHDVPYCSELGSIGIKRFSISGLCRIW